VAGTGSQMGPTVGFKISSVESSGSASRELVRGDKLKESTYQITLEFIYFFYY
jgi:hypothetical protein